MAVFSRCLARTCALALVLAPLAAFAGVDAEIDAVAKISGTIAPEGEVDTVRFDAVAGTALTLAVSSKKAAIDFDLVLSDPGDDPVDLSTAAKFTDTGPKVKVAKLVLDQTGEYTLQIKGAGTGEYKLTIKGKPGKKFTASLDVASGASDDFDFSAPADSKITFKAKAAKGSPAVPRFGDFGGQDLSAQGKLKPTSHVVTLDAVAAGGDLSVEVDNTGATQGVIDVTVTVKAPKVPKAKLDFRGESLGNPAGGETVVSESVGAGGDSVTVDDEDSALDGASVDVPAGAVSEDTRITLASAVPVVLDDPDADQSAGPSLELGPAGTTFAQPVTVTVPYDPTRLPFGANPATDIEVLKVQEDGTTAVLTPTAVDEVGKTVSVEVTSFSTFAPFAERGSPQLDGREYWFMFGEFEHISDGGGNTSFQREIFQGYGTAEFGGAGPMSFSLTGMENALEHDHDGAAVGSSSFTTGVFEPSTGGGDPDGEEGDWSYLASGQQIRLGDPGDGDDLWVSRDGRFLTGIAETDPVEGVNSLAVLVEKPAQMPTFASLAGTYQYGELFYEAFVSGGPVNFSADTTAGTLTLRENGTYRIDVDGYLSEFFGGAVDRFDEGDVDEGTYTVEPDGSVRISSGPQEDDFFFPGADGEVLVGAVPLSGLGEVFLAVAVRQGSQLGNEVLDGDYATVGLELEVVDDSINATPIADLETFQLSDVISFDGDGAAAHDSPIERSIFRNAGVAGGVEIDGNPETFIAATYAVNKSGKFTSSNPDGGEGLVGGVTPNGELGFWVRNPKDESETHGLFFFLELPPLNP